MTPPPGFATTPPRAPRTALTRLMALSLLSNTDAFLANAPWTTADWTASGRHTQPAIGTEYAKKTIDLQSSTFLDSISLYTGANSGMMAPNRIFDSRTITATGMPIDGSTLHGIFGPYGNEASVQKSAEAYDLNPIGGLYQNLEDSHLIANMQRAPTASMSTTEPDVGLWEFDIAGPYATTGFGGANYSLDGHNPASNAIWAMPLKSKDEAYHALALHKVTMDNAGAPAAVYRFDLGGEFTRTNTDVTCAYLGIATEWVTPDKHLRGERAHGIADAGMRANLAAAPTVSPRFWPPTTARPEHQRTFRSSRHLPATRRHSKR